VYPFISSCPSLIIHFFLALFRDWCAAAQHAPAPWAPRAAFVPEAPRKNLFSPGVPLEGEDALCGFMFVKPNFFKPPPGPVKAFALKVARIFRCKATTNTSKNKLKTQAPARVQAAPLGKQEAKSLFVVEVLLDSPAQKSEKAVVDTTGSAVGSHSGDNSSKTSRAAPSSLASSLRVSFTRTRSPRPLSSNPIRPVSSRSPSTAPLPDSAAHSTSDSPGSKVGGPAKKDVKKCSFVRIHRILWSRFFDMHTPAGSGREKADSRKSTSAPSKLNRSSRTSSAPSSSGPSLGSALGACVTDWFQRRFRTKVKCGALKGLDLTIC
jgi:hypothetical protein